MTAGSDVIMDVRLYIGASLPKLCNLKNSDLTKAYVSVKRTGMILLSLKTFCIACSRLGL